VTDFKKIPSIFKNIWMNTPQNEDFGIGFFGFTESSALSMGKVETTFFKSE